MRVSGHGGTPNINYICEAHRRGIRAGGLSLYSGGDPHESIAGRAGKGAPGL